MNKILKRELAAYKKQRKPLVQPRKSSKKVSAAADIKYRSRKERGDANTAQDTESEGPSRRGMSGISVHDYKKQITNVTDRKIQELSDEDNDSSD